MLAGAPGTGKTILAQQICFANATREHRAIYYTTLSEPHAKLVEHLEKGAKFDLLKTREGYYRNWDHQLMMEMYTLTFKPPEQVKDKWDLFTLSAPVPGANESLESIAPTREENNCTMPA